MWVLDTKGGLGLRFGLCKQPQGSALPHAVNRPGAQPPPSSLH